MTLSDYIRIINEVYLARPELREIICKPDIIDGLVETLFQAVSRSGKIRISDELALIESRTSISTKSLAEQEELQDENFHADTSSSVSAVRRGGTSALITKTSPHVSRKTGATAMQLRLGIWTDDGTSEELY